MTANSIVYISGAYVPSYLSYAASTANQCLMSTGSGVPSFGFPAVAISKLTVTPS